MGTLKINMASKSAVLKGKGLHAKGSSIQGKLQWRLLESINGINIDTYDAFIKALESEEIKTFISKDWKYTITWVGRTWLVNMTVQNIHNKELPIAKESFKPGKLREYIQEWKLKIVKKED
jgi:hypothetical protein